MTATEPQKKEEKREVKKDPKFTEVVSVRKYLAALKGFVDKPQDNIDAYRVKIKVKGKEQDVFYLSQARLADFDEKSEITDKDGNTYRIDKKFMAGAGEKGYGCLVSLVSAPKKKEPE